MAQNWIMKSLSGNGWLILGPVTLLCIQITKTGASPVPRRARFARYNLPVCPTIRNWNWTSRKTSSWTKAHRKLNTQRFLFSLKTKYRFIIKFPLTPKWVFAPHVRSLIPQWTWAEISTHLQEVEAFISSFGLVEKPTGFNMPLFLKQEVPKL